MAGIVKAKYLGNHTISTVKDRLDDSPVWQDLLKIRHVYPRGRGISVKNGRTCAFWVDRWLDNKAPCELFPVLFNLCTDKNIFVYSFLERGGHVSFTRWLSPLLFHQWLQLLDRLYSFPFENRKDVVAWKWNKSGHFSTKSVYEHITKADKGQGYKHIWKAKIPYKIKFFLWLLELNAVLTKENMIKRKWFGDPSCYFCSAVETTDHLFFVFPVAKVVWRIFGHCSGADSVPVIAII